MAFHPYPQVIPQLFNVGGFGPPLSFTSASACPWVAHLTSRLHHATPRPIQTRFPCASGYYPLSWLRSITRGLILQKARCHPVSCDHRAPTVRTHTVSGSFHSPIQGYFSPFPHGTSSLSVTEEYLGLGVGPPRFQPGFTCPVVLRYQLGALRFRLQGCYLLWPTVPGAFVYLAGIP